MGQVPLKDGDRSGSGLLLLGEVQGCNDEKEECVSIFSLLVPLVEGLGSQEAVAREIPLISTMDSL